MKALSLTQPMAWAMFHGKRVENRKWNTYYRGEFYVHASNGFNKEHYDWLSNHSYLLNCDLPKIEDFLHGVLLGTAYLVRVMKKTGVNNPISTLSTHGRIYSAGDIQRELEILGGDEFWNSEWFWGEFGFVIQDAKELEKPIPCKGSLNFFEPEITVKV